MDHPNLTTSQLVSIAKRLRDECAKNDKDAAFVECLRYTLTAAGYSVDAIRVLMVGKPKHGILVEPDK